MRTRAGSRHDHKLRRGLALLVLGCTPLAGLQAQESPTPAENVRMEHAQVLRAEPVYQTLRATRMVQSCETPMTAAPAPKPDAEAGNGLVRLFDKVKGLVSRDRPAPAPPPGAAREARCRMVPENREFNRPIAYDVDYVYKGNKYRSRLPYDPGSRLKVRVSVTPQLAPSAQH